MRARGRPHHARHHPAAEPDVRHAVRPRGHHRAGLRPRRHRRLHRGGRRLPRRSTGSRRRWTRRSSWRTVLRAGLPRGRPGDPAAARAEGHPRATRWRSTGSRTRATGCCARPGVAVRARDRPDDGHPLEGHLRAPRGRDRLHGDGREHPRGHHHQEPLAALRRRPLDRRRHRDSPSTSPTGSTTPRTRSRPRSRRARCRRASRWRCPSTLNFVGAFLSLEVAATIADGHRRRGRRDAADRVRRADRRDRLEPGDLVVRTAVLLLARADRRHDRRDDRRQRARRAVIWSGLVREGRDARAWWRRCWRCSPRRCRS